MTRSVVGDAYAAAVDHKCPRSLEGLRKRWLVLKQGADAVVEQRELQRRRSTGGASSSRLVPGCN